MHWGDSPQSTRDFECAKLFGSRGRAAAVVTYLSDMLNEDDLPEIVGFKLVECERHSYAERMKANKAKRALRQRTAKNAGIQAEIAKLRRQLVS